MGTPEGDLKMKVVSALNKSGHFYRRMQSGKARVKGGFLHLAPEGTADFVVCRPSRMPEWIELKAEGQKTAKDREAKQAAFAEEVRLLGHRYAICKSVEEVLEFLH